MKEKNQYLKKGLTGKKLNKVKGIVIHWFASPNAKATNVIKYWEGQANGVNAHDVICLDGTVYHAVPYSDMCYQVGRKGGYESKAVKKLSAYPNDCVVGIECAHLDMKGKMTDATYKSLVELSAKLVKKFKLTVEDLWLHSEIVGKDYKDCHRWFTTTKPSDWAKFKKDVANMIDGSAKAKPAKVVAPKAPIKTASKSEIKSTGTIKIICDALNVRVSDSLDSKVQTVVKKGEVFTVVAEKNGMYKLKSGLWCSSSNKYVKFTKSK